MTGHEKIFAISGCSNHNFSRNIWIDDKTIVLHDQGANKVYIIDINTKSVKFSVNAKNIGHNVFNDKLLLGDAGSVDGIYTFDCATGQKKLIISKDKVGTLCNPLIGGNDDPSTWGLGHFQFSQDGAVIAIKIKAGGSEKNKYLITCKVNGEDLENFGPKPMHFFWYDSSTIAGHDNQIADGQRNNRQMRRWDRSHQLIETLAGSGNHAAMSFDKQWYASDSWYHSSSVKLSLYKKGTTQPRAVLNLGSFSNTVWTLGNHLNPAFSRDGKRVYFIKPANNDGKSQAYYWDLTRQIQIDTIPPSVPCNLNAQPFYNNCWIDLSWSSSTDNVDVVDYHVYRNDELIDRVSDTTFIDKNVSSEKTYHYRVAAIDAAGNISTNSSLATAASQSNKKPEIYRYSSEYDANRAENLLDGITKEWSRWSAEGFPQWVIIDYGQQLSISGTRLWTCQHRSYRFTIALSNSPDSNYKTIVDHSAANIHYEQLFKNEFTPVNARYVKINIIGDDSNIDSWCHLSEFDIVLNSVTNVSMENDGLLPENIELCQNYPNPFNPSTSIKFSIPFQSWVQLAVCDLLGRKIKTLISGTLSQGRYEAVWNGIDSQNDQVTAGMYLLTLKCKNQSLSRKMLLIR
ncbi:MAG: discoidin domain-containing protein [candidate division KSB1 bacterium]|nr:discoidin domain-containing protein [candidate division KSB1 bacterium]